MMGWRTYELLNNDGGGWSFFSFPKPNSFTLFFKLYIYKQPCKCKWKKNKKKHFPHVKLSVNSNIYAISKVSPNAKKNGKVSVNHLHLPSQH